MHGLPAHPERAALPPWTSTWSTRSFVFWLTVLPAASVTGAVLTHQLIPAGGGDLFESPALVPTVAVLTVLCGLAGGFAPKVGPYWGLVPVLPYSGAFFSAMNDQPAIGADLAPLGYLMLLAWLAVPWFVGFTAGLVRR